MLLDGKRLEHPRQAGREAPRRIAFGHTRQERRVEPDGRMRESRAQAHHGSALGSNRRCIGAGVLPAVDLRKDKSVDVKYQKLVKGSLNYFLPRMGYQVKFAETLGGVSNITEDDIAREDISFVKNLGPENARWIFLVTLDDLAKRRTFGNASAAECSGILYDKNSGKAVWRHKAVHQYGEGTLVGMMMAGTVRDVSVQGCAEDLLTQMPTKNGKKWYAGYGGIAGGSDKTLFKSLR